ncbi:flagellar biosynthesis protein FlhF [Bacillus rubiinfantis]|uniref:flagellar biosynthesis protein FlhF n=1 Tax=Bacillus rubiinfantis TaxID=1499680 RepID=UPI0005A84DE3|nr:flagellar biosynthesis protein FlhF [Bacillus rubiinfantis]
MKTKKIVADSIPLALKMVRQQLGDNAIIVNTRAVKSGGIFGFFAKQKYEVTAYAVDKAVVPPAERRDPVEQKTNRPEMVTSPTSIKKNGVHEETVNFSPEEKSQLIEQMLEKRNHLHGNEEERTSYRRYKLEQEEVYPASHQQQEERTDAVSSVFHKKPQMLYQYYSQSTKEEHPEPIIAESRLSSPAPTPPTVEPVSAKAEPAARDVQLLDEIKSLRNMMMVFMSGEKQENGAMARLSKWINRLKKQGVDEEVLEKVVIDTMNTVVRTYGSLENATDDEIEKQLIAIVQHIIENRIPTSYVLPEDVRLVNIIGPTGVGKTTSIAKLATEQILKQKRRVAMITTDVYRIAAVEQLKTYATILNVPIEVARSREELDQAIMKLKHFDLIYMDTTGRNFKDEKNRESAREFLTHSLKSDNFLALSLTTKYEDLQLLLNEFLDSPVKKLILTKYDETSSYGSILNIAYHYPYEIVYITTGQSVPEDIMVIDAAELAHSIVGDER